MSRANASDAGRGPAGAHPAPFAARAATYEPEALLDLFDRSVDRVHGLAFALAGDGDRAGELARAAFERCLERLPELRRKSARPEDWMVRVGAQVMFEQLRPDDPEAAPPGPVRALAGLSGSTRDAVALHVVCAMSVAAVAAAMGRREASVRRLLVRGTSALGGALGGLESLSRPHASEALRLRLRTLFLAQAAERRVDWVHRHELRLLASRRPRSRHFHFLRASLTVIILGVAVVLGVAIAIGAGFSDPGSPLYAFKRGGENALLVITRDPVSRSGLEVSLAAERLKEAEVVSTQRQPEITYGLIQSRDRDLLDAVRALAGSADRGSGAWLAAKGKLAAEAAQPVTVVERNLEQSGESATAHALATLSTAFQADWSRAAAGLANPKPRAPRAAPSPSPR